MSRTESPNRVIASQTLFRGLEIVDAVADGCRNVQTIAERTGMAFSTAHRIASALVQVRYLSFEPRKGYSLGSKLVELGFLAYRQSDLTVMSRERLEWLAGQTLDTVHLAALDDNSVVYLDKVGGQRPIEVNSRIGGRKPVCSTGVGKSLILDSGEAAWRVYYEREANGEPQPLLLDEWLKRMHEYASGGYTFDLGENQPRIRCVAAPIRDGSGKIVAAVSVTSTVDYTDDQRLAELVPMVKAVANQISAKLGA
ncbi:IclR family transcriptional regulator [Burkholderia multivorans]|uniref:IclR family transcriptional regulator n=1 Tax=Burkholderia multivorans TaxID=87883 RepID=UPI002018F504|nr:IclR family transcriptional regulator [Burkholderia multivorans]MCL4661362.1 IclR family transcriptional regulator [Burkholderia multivorans]MCO1352792.1 IclR family transcriptional regulator [Burkholderia multivorans]MCO1413361.1 IclR family transcriptional regulator [Burkholderia multivorans]MCO1446448.1 IclR family transcriptional regulator [Burkholderia multivorans]UQP46861.1 IclR family transcriptional regulator [Burkholderia multivorans]